MRTMESSKKSDVRIFNGKAKDILYIIGSLDDKMENQGVKINHLVLEISGHHTPCFLTDDDGIMTESI